MRLTDYTPDHIVQILAGVGTIITVISGWGVWSVFKEKRKAPEPQEAPLVMLTRRLDDLQNRLSYLDSRVLKHDDDSERLMHEIRDMLIEIRVHVRRSPG